MLLFLQQRTYRSLEAFVLIQSIPSSTIPTKHDSDLRAAVGVSYHGRMAERQRTAIIGILAGLLIILSTVHGIAFVIGFSKISSLHIASNVPPSEVAVLNFLGKNGVLGVILLFDVAVFCIGIGLWRLRPWARKVVLVVSVVSIFIALFFVGLCLFQFDLRGFVDVCLQALLWGWWLYYFNRARVKELFAPQPGNQTATPPSG